MIPRDDNGQIAARQRRDANREVRIKLADQQARIAELEAAIDKLAQCKGRFHTEANFKALIEVRNKSLHK